jgi:molybdopterin-guanine dinucleotide biosynthesis protein A
MAEGRRREGDPPRGAVLAGGRGSRLGGAKATAELAGRPLISYPLSALDAAGIECQVVAKPDCELPSLAGRAQLVVEPRWPRHPLCGIVAALRAPPSGAVIVLPCDMPFVTPALLELLIGATEPLVVPSHRGHVQPLPGRYSAALLPKLEPALGRGEPLRETIAALAPRVLDEDALGRCGDPGSMLFNVNDGEDLRQAEELLASREP